MIYHNQIQNTVIYTNNTNFENKTKVLQFLCIDSDLSYLNYPKLVDECLLLQKNPGSVLAVQACTEICHFLTIKKKNFEHRPVFPLPY